MIKLGKIVVSKVVQMQLSREEVQQYIDKHRAGNWGFVSKKQRKYNELGRGPLQSYYHSSSGELLLYTEADRSATYVEFKEV